MKGKVVTFIFTILLLCSFKNIRTVSSEIAFTTNELNIFQDSYENFASGLQFFKQYPNFEDSTFPIRCLAHLEAIFNGIKGNSLTSLKFIDSWGKFPAGLLKGNTIELGNFNECLEIRQTLNNDDHLRGKYCLASFPVSQFLNGSIEGLGLQVKLGICVPQACSATTVNTILKGLVSKSFNISLDPTTTLVKERHCSKDAVEFTALDWVTIVLLSVLAFLLLVSTSFDYSSEYLQKPLHPLLGAFSIRVNAKQLFHIRTSQNSPHIIPCLNGIRVLSIIWIIFAHCYMMVFLFNATDNALDVLSWLQNPFAMFVLNATPSVDTFFFLSGLLLSMIALREMTKTKGRLNIPMMYIHRILRLTPVLAVALLFYMTLIRYMGDGPLWNSDTNFRMFELCNKSWWATLLYVQNYVYPGEMCFGHTWYLSVDTQLYFLSPLALILLWKWGRKGLAVLVVVVLLFFACLFSIIMVNELVIFDPIGGASGNDKAQSLTYYVTHARINPWLIGIMFGYYLHCQKGKRVTMPKWLVLWGWIVAIGLVATVIFSLHGKTQPGAVPLTPLGSAFYLSLSRIAWPLALCWIVFACMNGYGGVINEFLSWAYWEPLSKLTYCMYIWHFVVETINAARVKTSFHFTDYDLFLRFWSDFSLSIMVAFIMYLAVEAPMANVEKAIFARKKPTKNVAESTNDRAMATTGPKTEA